MDDSRSDGLFIDDVTLSYDGRPVIEGLTLTVGPGTFLGLIGPNGAGKTSLLLGASGQFKPSSGTVRFRGLDAYDANREFKQTIGFVHEEPFLYPYLTTEDFMRFVAGVKRVPAADVGREVASLLDMVGLMGERTKVTSNLSMGMRKKLAIAAAMLGRPRLLFLDEALNGVDFESTYRIKQALRDFVEGGGTVILSTHTLEVIEKLCDRYVLLRNGQVIADLTAAEVAHAEGPGSLESYVIRLFSESGPSS